MRFPLLNAARLLRGNAWLCSVETTNPTSGERERQLERAHCSPTQPREEYKYPRLYSPVVISLSDHTILSSTITPARLNTPTTIPLP